MRIHAAQPDSVAEGMAGALTLGPMGEEGEGCVFWSIISLILKLIIYSKRVSCSLQCQETLSREIYCQIISLYMFRGFILYLLTKAFAIFFSFPATFLSFLKK